MNERGHLDVAEWRAFFEQTMSETERETARDHIASCPQCAQVFKSARSAGLAALGTQSPRRSPSPIRILVPIAAMLSIAIVSVFLFSRNTVPVTEPRAAASTTIAPRAPLVKPPVVVGAEQLLSTRGTDDNTKYLEALAEALRPYDQNDFTTAIARLEPLAKDHSDRFEPVFYLGASLLMAGRSTDAIPLLERAAAIVDGARREMSATALAAARRAAQP